jgi:peptidoglycan/xylan/chitin deacetylase (PgdA/CDA1 family)
MYLLSLLLFDPVSESILLAVAFGAAAPLRMLQPDEAILPDFMSRLSHFAARSIPLRLHRIRNGQPVVSFTFDDFPASAHEKAAPILEAFGARASFFAATALLGKPHPLWKMADPDAIPDLADRGHEIGLHTHGHAPLWQTNPRTLTSDIEKNLNMLQDLSPRLTIESFAYPYGVLTARGKWKLSGMMRANRSTHPGLNHGWIDLDFVRAYELSDSRISLEQVTKILDAAAATGGWVVFFAHEISTSSGLFKTSPDLLASTIKAALEREIHIRLFTSALDQIGVPQRSVLLR